MKQVNLFFLMVFCTVLLGCNTIQESYDVATKTPAINGQGATNSEITIPPEDEIEQQLIDAPTPTVETALIPSENEQPIEEENLEGYDVASAEATEAPENGTENTAVEDAPVTEDPPSPQETIDPSLTSIGNGLATIQLSKAWRVINLDEPFLTDGYDKITESNPRLKSALSDEAIQQLTLAGIQFYAINLEPDFLMAPHQPTINLITQDFSEQEGFEGEFSVVDYAKLTISELEAYLDLNSTISQSAVQLGDTAGIKIQYSTYLTNQNGQQLEVMNTQYILEQAPKQFAILTLATPFDFINSHLSQFTVDVESFRLK